MKQMNKKKGLAQRGRTKLKSALLRCTLLILGLLVGANCAWAQTNLWMKDGHTDLVNGQTINFYDSHGPSQASTPDDPTHPTTMDVNYWDRWYNSPEHFTHTFNAPASAPYVKVTFHKYTAYAWTDAGDYQAIPPVAPYNCQSIGDWSLRLNDDVLKVYAGSSTSATLIGEYTGNSKQEFTIYAQGSMTFDFVSNALFREEGWYATVEAVTSAVPTPPYMRRSSCYDAIELVTTTPGATLYYTTDGNQPSVVDPLQGTQIYDGTAIQWGSGDLTIRAVSVVDGETSEEASVTFTDADRITDISTDEYTPSIVRVPNTNTVRITCPSAPEALNETFVVYYTTNGTAPSLSNYAKRLAFVNSSVNVIDETATSVNVHYSRSYEFEWLVPNTTFKAKIYGLSCNNLESKVGTLINGSIFVPDPVISFTPTTGNGTATLTCSMDGAAIYYTLDGSEPTTDSHPYEEPFSVQPGQTVRARAMVATTGFVSSAIVSDTYIPNGNDGQPASGGVYGSVVLLDDREDHTWSYYSDPTSPIRSLNPADVKITYYGFGNGTMTTTDNSNNPTTFAGNVTGTQVAVSATEAQNQFVYLKTLERKGGDVATSLETSTGRCPYVTIPNPFSKRPTSGSGDSRWRGFYAWRVKTVRGGSIYTTASNGTALTDGAIVNAEAQLYFAPESPKGMEVEFEALWARAYVTTGTSAMTTHVNSYERNFHVLTNNAYVNNFSNIGYPLTISARYPDGSGNSTATVRLNAGCNLNNDLKLENISFRAGGEGNNLSANGYYLCLGRGINTDIELCNRLIGSNGSQKNHDFTIRAESGLINSVYLTNGGVPDNYRFHCNFILGCDYDRATNANTKLLVAPSNQIVFGQGMISGAVNRSARTLNCFIKSGTFQSGYHNTNNEVGENTHSIYIGSTNGHNETGYSGKRYITIEGGEIANIAGGRGAMTAAYAPAQVTDTVVSIRIKGGTVHGSVYGGASSSTSYGSRKIVVTGGEVQGWIATGCNSTSTGYGGVTSGTGNIYIGGKSIIGGANPRTINGTVGGNVFGAGHGKDTENAASMSATCIVVADDADILHNVYGGGNYGYVYPAGQDAYDGEHKADIYILGGTIHDNVFGGANMNEGQHVYITMNGGEVQGSVYGGSNTFGMIHEDATITMNGGLVKGSVYGGGFGGTYEAANHDYVGTVMAKHTSVTINGGTINNNVYGGGEQGAVMGNTNVAISGGSVKNVYGAGKGSDTQNANIGGNTVVTVSGGMVNESVYGGGEQGTVAYTADGATTNHTSTVTMSGGTVKGDIFGGGREGTTQGQTIVNVSGGDVMGNVFGGAYGKAQQVFVAGAHTVNITGNEEGGYPFIRGSVYGGSRLANDGQNLTLTHNSFDNSTVTDLSSVVNISGGRIKEHVYAAGYYGRCFGSVYVNIGANAVADGPYNTNFKRFEKNNVYIQGSVWAGGDWGTFAGEFGNSTITGRSSIYLDGEGYNTESTVYTDANYMNLGFSVLGCGTSCNAGKNERLFVMRNYGQMKTMGATTVNPISGTSRSLYSTQLFTKVYIDNSHITFTGQGKVNDLNTTEKYAMYQILNETEDGGVFLANGSSLVLDKPASQLNSFHSVTCTNTFAATPSCTTLGRDGLFAAHLDGNDNKVRVNNGSYIEVRYDKTVDGTTKAYYGEVDGYAHMMTSVVTDEATCAYARPKQATSSPISNTYDNSDDGGFLSYDGQYNTYDADGKLINNGNSYQLPYENHAPTRDNTEYFRVWRYGGGIHYVEGVVNVQQVGEPGASGTAEYLTTDVTIQLPAWRASGAYYRFDRVGDPGSYYTMIDYGTDVITYNAASYGETPGTNNWMYFGTNAQQTGVASTACPEITQLNTNPDQNFGLIIMPGNAMTSASTSVSNYIICSSSDSYIAENLKYNCNSYNEMPTVTFRLTYRNNISSNTTWDPVTIPLVQCLADGIPKETVYITLTVNTMTTIESEFKTQLYAQMKGDATSNRKHLVGKIVLPTFETAGFPGVAKFYVESAKFDQAVALDPEHPETEVPNGTVSYKKFNENMDINSFGLTVEAMATPDNMDDWRDVQPAFDCAPISSGNTQTFGDSGYLGYAGGRSGLSIGFNLYYSDHPEVLRETLMGTLTLNMKFTDYAGSGDHIGHFTIVVEVYRRGEGDNFYVDGIYGVDDTELNRGKYPDHAAKTVEYVLSRLGFKAGDNIFIVNQVDINKPLTWDGTKKQDDVNIWRYPGNHPLMTTTGITGNTLNNAYTGLLFNVNKQLTMKSIKVDGMYAEATATVHHEKIYPTTPNPSSEGSVLFDGKADAPLFAINANGRLNLRNNCRLLYNNNGNAGSGDGATYAGAVWVKSGAILAMNETSTITGNINANGGGVYMDGSMVVSTDAYVFDNHKTTATNAAQNNVWLTKGTAEDMYKVVQIGLASDEAFNALAEHAKIGIDKAYTSDAYTIDDYLPVVYSETTEDLEAPYNANRDNAAEGIIVHDLGKYKLEKYTPNTYLYWLSTWVTYQDHEPDGSVEGEGTWEDIDNIHTPQQLAWFISLVNGENGAVASDYSGKTIKITDDISMDGHVWVPIGTPTHPFKGTFEANGHVITDMYGSLIQPNMGMFGYTDNANIQNAVVSTRFTGTNDNLGTVVGTMNGGTLSNVEGAGSITNKASNSLMGGLVGNNVGGTIHSAFAVANMTGGSNMGGLVGKNTGNLYNAYSHVDFAKLDGQTTNMVASGLVAENTGTVENCYVIEGSHQSGTFYTFAANNTNGTINYCYAAKPAEGTTVTYVGSGTQPTTHGTYDLVKGRKELGYMYGDNKTEKVGSGENAYITAEDKIYYAGGKIDKWRGLVSTLNQWVKANPRSLDPAPASWFRPTTGDINGDLPVLGFPKDNSMATEDGKFLFYGASDEVVVNEGGVATQANNGLDNLFTKYNGKTANMFLYGKAIEVANVPAANTHVFINEDAVLIQANGAEDFINATVGVTFDNSKHTATDYYGHTLAYDWHFMSTPLSNAPMGITYSAATGNGGGVNITAMENNYFPNNLPMTTPSTGVKWDLYTYFEPEYHWINLKRSGDNHYHTDGGAQIHYVSGQMVEGEPMGQDQNETIFVPGKGYMMAISQDSYMNSTGTLNNGDVEITLYKQELQAPAPEALYNEGWNLVGNPYQAYLDLNKVGAGNYYIYDAESNAYVPYAVQGSENPVTPSRYIHPHQGFFMHTDTDNTTFTFGTSMATTKTDNGSYFRGDDRINYPLVNLFATNESGNTDLAIVEFNRPEIGGATKVSFMTNANFSIAAHLNGEGYGLLFTPEGTEKVPVHFKAQEDGTYTLTWSTYNGDFSSLLLVDNKTGVITDMLRADKYTFDASADDYSSRFYLTYSVTGIDENEGTVNETFAWFDGSEWVVNGQGQLDVVDMLGRTLRSERLTSDQSRVSLNGVSAGVYLMRVTNGKAVKVQKVIVK